MQLSLLDRARTRAGEPDAAALAGTVARAARAEQLGYDRFWVAEHHGVPGVAGSAPAVLLAAITGRTTTLRLGSAGVMLPHHQPLVVAEQFAILSALAPGRVDLGLGRSPGFTAPVRRALRSTDEQDFAGDLAELRAFLTGSAEITAYPRPTTAVPMYVLATGQGLQVAAELGLPVSLDVLVADTAAEATDLLLPEAWAMASARTTGVFRPLEPVAGIRARTLSPRQQQYVEQTAAAAIAGTPAQVASRLAELVDRTGAAELVASSSTHDRAALAASDAALAGLLGRPSADR
ncbi:MsnO8 family LLM class oxidoreductase [Modestobacter sp. VKM Ac-2983]|uniref:MsnO8 family LLM class oxidoreductase n=1 Tax=Modestobacter sp. VKM Ac-2983 TaxID=3004137 RepID=UPI0022AB626D|nr:MsnO8 family LLM class oxidoreductase [Modestobacter sp. VKM Ac-2983]MCZ2804288.1 MsnO8 family LLM class oxidoreductase [Modestobacter sp. VKM Ac-2983]